MKKYAVIVAGGSGMRMGTAVPKQFLELRGKPVLWYTINTFLESYTDLEVILVLPETHLETGLEIIRGVKKAEGKEVLVPYRGPVAGTVQEILGGVRSACTYVGARRLRELSKRTTFVRVTQQLNEVFGK